MFFVIPYSHLRRIFAMNILVVVSFFVLGCRNDESSSGDVAIDLIIDISNGKIGDKWLNEEQRNKYINLANLESFQCYQTMIRAFSQLLVDDRAKAQLTSDEQNDLEIIRKFTPEQQDRSTRFVANKVCTKLLILKHER